MSTGKIDYKNIFYPPGGILIWILILLEMLTFGIALTVLIVYSRENPELFHRSSSMLNVNFGVINTIFLLVSGFFMATAVHQFKTGGILKASFFIKLAILGGTLFLLLKGFEYYEKLEAGISLGYNTFFTFYWLLTGFHVIHVIVGIVILLFINNAVKNGNSALEDVEAGAAFWHMCDLIWLLLFPVLYLVL